MKMSSENFAMGIFLLSQITVGMLGNSSVLFHYIILIHTGKHLMPKDLIIEHLTFANCLSIISKGIPRTMSDLGFKDFLDDIGCKLIMYISRITRGVSLYAMCLLNCFQAIIISISNSRWMKLKYRATKYIGPSCSVSWLVHLVLNIIIPARMLGPSYKKNATNWVSYEYCSLFPSSSMTTVLYMFLLSFSDVLCLSLMACASVSMINILYKHKRQVKHIHSTQHFLKVSPEDRATQTILILLCMFVISYSFSSVLTVLRTCSKYPVLWGVNVFTFIEISFPILCPFVLIINMKSSFILFLPCFGKK
ncbi:vomeronasal type-1 receptor 4 isoform X1 [Rattus norvegicus]|uniref:vomeronasal 1 receptor 42 n=1 Tax=Rattus norvegicus TaxID=10116 RepID=UPI000017FFF8|nr:vomeronasal type-1 receptor 4 isoform X1 [Rattus norvegicus]XP_017445029.1 vomeronasal type-1 receptor 4 isoform X1 [Rattus norvegicus]XP_038956639.1 vomeronasal type-1 receptor 4 isoform X1 [Rattus norvegicus]XP_038956648.1 vomeronasal type-1 receptor 4 isoform X1 [Rattus norvegicus]XP_038956655.1 vomeronasal type-1 receptor 4 isoform X1 [Rattus norvegicus]|eukprot:NP_001008959.1 vomeronasal 1 receptor 42 [Rattus norvegicus]